MIAIDPISGRRMARPGVPLPNARRESLVLAIISIMMMGCEQNRAIRSAGVPVPQIVAHRGASHDAPENTLAAFRLGFEQGADAIEGDFRMTRDGVIIAMHDADLRRTTGDPRRVEDVDFEDLQQLDAGSWGRWAGGAFIGERVPRLEEVLAIVPEARVLFIEVKGTLAMVPALIETIARSALDRDRVAIICFDARVIAACKKQMPEVKALWITAFKDAGGVWTPTAAEVIANAERMSADGIDVQANPEVVTSEFVAEVHAAGLECHVWTIDDPEAAIKIRSTAVDSITTNQPAKLRAILR